MNETVISESRPVFQFSIKQMLILVSVCCLVSALSVQLEFTPLAGAGAMSMVAMLWLYRIASGPTDVSAAPKRGLRWRVGWAVAIGSVGCLCGASGVFMFNAARWWESVRLPCIILVVFFIAALPGVIAWFVASRIRDRHLRRDSDRVAVLCNAAWTLPYAAAILVYVWLWYSSQRFVSSDGMFAVAVAAVFEWTIVTLGIADTKRWWKRRKARGMAEHDLVLQSSSFFEETGNDVPT